MKPTTATIKFKAKIEAMYQVGGDEPLYTYVSVPQFKRSHCDMQAFRSHPKYGSYANSDLFLGMLSRIRAETLRGGLLKIEDLPDNVTVDCKGFLAEVTITV